MGSGSLAGPMDLERRGDPEPPSEQGTFTYLTRFYTVRLLRRAKYQNAAAATRTIRTIHQYSVRPPSPPPGPVVEFGDGCVVGAPVVAMAFDTVRTVRKVNALIWPIQVSSTARKSRVAARSHAGRRCTQPDL